MTDAQERDEMNELAQVIAQDHQENLGKLRQQLAVSEQELREIVSLLGCHRAYVLHSIRDLQSATENIPNIDIFRQLQATVTAQHEEVRRLQAIIDASKPTYSIRPSFHLDPDELASGKETT